MLLPPILQLAATITFSLPQLPQPSSILICREVVLGIMYLLATTPIHAPGFLKNPYQTDCRERKVSTICLLGIALKMRP
ncbi:hypothetical protein F5Y18DRAFT_324803 [Xylariaceae sp. FL1019]|nr:hypothetical protein F5Y18DRAFT_324803 [Xylariaceae sp. FL1019]